jgi:hypothetical protein
MHGSMRRMLGMLGELDYATDYIHAIDDALWIGEDIDDLYEELQEITQHIARKDVLD